MLNEKQKGMTLIEVLVALFIVALALSSGLMIVGQYTSNLIAVQERTWAHWAAMNNVVALQLSEEWPKEGKVDGSEKETPYSFSWQRTINETPFDRVRRIEVQVKHETDDEQLVKINSYIGRESGW